MEAGRPPYDAGCTCLPSALASQPLYEVLQVSPTAPLTEIRAAYRALARRYHPDLNGMPDATVQMRRLNAAYRVLSQPAGRARYDAQLRSSRGRGSCPCLMRWSRPEPAERLSTAPLLPPGVSPLVKVGLVLVLFLLVAAVALMGWFIAEGLSERPHPISHIHDYPTLAAVVAPQPQRNRQPTVAAAVDGTMLFVRRCGAPEPAAAHLGAANGAVTGGRRRPGGFDDQGACCLRGRAGPGSRDAV